MRVYFVEGYIQAIFFVLYDDGRVLILDGACRSDSKKIMAFLKEKMTPKGAYVKLQVVSHSHPDHAGAAPLLRKRYGFPIAAPKNINSWYAGFGGFLQHKVDILLSYLVVNALKRPWKNMYYKRFIPMDHALEDGDFLPGFPDWQALFTPGHTGHDMVFYHADSKTLYVADVILYVRGRFYLPFPVTLPSEMAESLLRIKNLAVKTLILAHGGKLEVPGMAAIVDRLLPYLDKAKETVMMRRLRPFTRFPGELRGQKIKDKVKR